MMKKYKNFIITMIFSMLIGGIIGALSGCDFHLNINFSENIYEYFFRGFLGIEIVLSVIIIFMIIFTNKKINNVSLDDVSTPLDTIIGIIIHLSTTSIIIGMTFMAIMLNKIYSTHKPIYVIIASLTVMFTTILQVLSIKCYNSYHPDRKLNMFENNSDKKYFERLDEGEKWIAYISSYKSFKGMQLVYSLVMAITMILSVIMTISIILPLVIALLWIIQISIYSIEASKYN